MSDDDDKKPTVGRRRFLFGTGLATVATGALEGCPAPQMPGGVASPIFGPGKVAVKLRVNGVERPLEIEPRTTLADALRHELGLTGTKIGCDRGACSACTVWLDGVPVCACTTFALDAVGRGVTTVEGLAQGDKLHPVQDAFIACDATQCGFCTPGMVMSCAALLAKNPRPTAEDVRAATSGNLCRCGTYPKVVAATLLASGHHGDGAGGAPAKKEG
jgi:xanthine dehydrogenase YagT iron-sulfur-binding subunit